MTEQCDSKSHLHQISIPGLPKCYRAVEIMVDPMSCNYIGDDGYTYITAKIKIEKIKPHRIVLEEISKEEYHRLFNDERCSDIYNMRGSYWREVKETDIPLNSDEPKLSLSVDECKKLMRIMEGFNVSDLSVKVHEFLKVKI